MSAEDLALAVKARRVELGLKQHEMAARGGPSLGVMQNIERAALDSYASITLAALDRCLGWIPGSAGDALYLGWTPGSAGDALYLGEAPVVHKDPKAAEDARAMRIGYAVLALLKELRDV